MTGKEVKMETGHILGIPKSSRNTSTKHVFLISKLEKWLQHITIKIQKQQKEKLPA